ncbi:50S ribosomal protein L9 [Candidatus Peribacteria bacterium]|nr:50S ribosomal protein L9 [Candidatus Peribacteria bacterium]
MEVLLLQDIPGIGKKNDLLMVGDGYALNCLLPRRQALIATPTVRKRYADVIKRRALERQSEIESKQSAAAAVAGKKVTFMRKATKTGKLYAAITEKIIVDALKEQLKIDLEETSISLPEQIKALGKFVASVEVAGRKEDLTVQVDQEK